MYKSRTIRCESRHCKAFEQLVRDYRNKSIDLIEKAGDHIHIVFPLVTYSISIHVFDELQKSIRF